MIVAFGRTPWFNELFDPDLIPDPDLPFHDPVAEEMLALNLDPDEVDSNSYLKARARAMQGEIKWSKVREQTLRYAKQRRARDRAIGLFLLENPDL